MKKNYDLIMLNKLKELEGKKNLMLHSCCAPCSSYVIEELSNYFNITVYYYNPNISPKEEYEKRKAEQIRLLDILNVPYLDVDYNNNEFLSCIKDLEKEREGGKRCYECILLRMQSTAKKAKDYDYFTTTLTLSPHKNSEVINNIGKLLESKYNIKYLYSDFKKRNGYKRSVELSRKYNLYRQDYCGCLFSKKEE